jgi:microsomal dipeptidase-like Zn-dependent dipeptidase
LAFSENSCCSHRAGIRRQLARCGKLAAELKRNYVEAAIGKILGGNLLRILRQVLP